jgi:hypothetical protein
MPFVLSLLTAILSAFAAIGTAFTAFLADKAAAKRRKTVDRTVSLRTRLGATQAASVVV